MIAPSVPRVAIVQIAFKEYGLIPFSAFVDSYRRHSAGVTHDLVIALKGFAGADDAAPFLAVLDGIPHIALHVPDGGLDIGTYLHVAERVHAATLLCLNSRTVIDAEDYAGKLIDCLDRPGIGAVSATGSWQSLTSDRRRASHANPLLRPMWRLKGRFHAWWWRSYFPPYPNPHLRTNGLMIRRDLLLRLEVGVIRTKLDAMRFESGWHGLTRQLAQLGFATCLVDRDGNCSAVGDWPAAGVFWADQQRGLMIRDNQTDRYAAAPPGERALLTSLAWAQP